MDTRLGLSLLLLLSYVTDTMHQNIRDGPMIHQRHNRRAALSEFLIPPPPSADRSPYLVKPRDFVPPPLPAPPPNKIRGPRNGKYLNPPQHPTESGYFSRLMGWFNVFGSNEKQYSNPSAQYSPPSFPRTPHHQQQQQPQYSPPTPNQSQYPDAGSSGSTTFSKPSPFSRGKSCDPCNQVPWVPITGSSIRQNSQHSINIPYPDVSHSSINSGVNSQHQGYQGYSVPQEYKQPDYHIEASLDLPFPLPNLEAHPTSANSETFPPYSPIYSGNMPPLYEPQNFVTPAHSGGLNEQISASGSSDVHQEALPESSDIKNIVKTVVRESSMGSHINFDNSKAPVDDITKQVQYLDASQQPNIIGTSQKVHFEQSPVIDISIPSESASAPISGDKKSTGSRKESATLIDYIVSGSNEYESTETTQKSYEMRKEQPDKKHSYVRNDHSKQSFSNEVRGSYKFHFDANSNELQDSEEDRRFSTSNNSALESSIEVFPIVHDGKTKHKQVQIIIPYTSQHTPSPFYRHHGNKKPESIAHSVNSAKAISSEQAQKIFDNIIGQESQTVPVTQLPDLFFHSSEVAYMNGKNNSIDVQRLQKNIDNWTIEEYSSISTPRSAFNSTSHPHLSLSKKIPREYLTTAGPNTTTEKLIVDDNSDEYTSATYGFDSYEDEIEHTTQALNGEATTVDLTFKDVENTTLLTIVQGRPWSHFEMGQFWPKLSTTASSKEKERVYVVTSQTVPPTAVNELSSKKKSIPEEKAKKKSQKIKKSYEPIERAYQVLPQAVNNLAVASTGPENLPLWGIMEHEDFVFPISKTESQTESVKTLSPILYSGHSKVSHASR